MNVKINKIIEVSNQKDAVYLTRGVIANILKDWTDRQVLCQLSTVYDIDIKDLKTAEKVLAYLNHRYHNELKETEKKLSACCGNCK
jgi:hypothetical protein